MSEWHADDNNCEGGVSSGSVEESCFHDGSAEIDGCGSLKTPSLLKRGKKFLSEIEDTCTYLQLA